MRVFLEHATKERKREEYPLKNSRRDRRHRLNLFASLRDISRCIVLLATLRSRKCFFQTLRTTRLPEYNKSRPSTVPKIRSG